MADEKLRKKYEEEAKKIKMKKRTGIFHLALADYMRKNK